MGCFSCTESRQKELDHHTNSLALSVSEKCIYRAMIRHSMHMVRRAVEHLNAG